MNVVRHFFRLVFAVSSVGLWAQDPVLQLERRDSGVGITWTGRTTLAFRVTLFPPVKREEGDDADFVIDPPGGWRSAVRLVVTDAAGKPVDWPFENRGGTIDHPLSLHRLGTASVSFLMAPKSNGVDFPVGRYQVRARLASTTGKWRGSVDSPPVMVEFVGRARPELEVIGLDEGPLFRGWPMLVGAKVTASKGIDGGLTLPTAQKDWAESIDLLLVDRAGSPVTLAIDRLPMAAAELGQSQLNAGDSRTIWFRLPAEATRSLGEGPYRWTAKFTLPASPVAADQWSGSVTAMTAPIPAMAPPTSLSAEYARRLTFAQTEDALVEAQLLRAVAEGGTTNARIAAAQRAAVPLERAEHLALQWHQSNPGDPSGAVLVANVMVAQEDKFRAVAYVRRAIEADLRQQSLDGAAETEPALPLRVMEVGFEAMADEPDAEVSPALHAALQQIRAANPPLPPSAPLPPAIAVSPTAPPAVPAPPPSAPLPPSAEVVNSPPGRVVGSPPATEVSLGQIVAASSLGDPSILADASGQWAESATAGTKYGKTQYAPAQATGAPNCMVAGNSPDAWCPENKNVGTDWLEVSFAKAVRATEVRVRQNDAVGAITKIEAISPDGTSHVWWQGVDPYTPARVREIVWFAVHVPKTDYLVVRVKITLNLATVPGWKEIDAVQLVGTAE